MSLTNMAIDYTKMSKAELMALIEQTHVNTSHGLLFKVTEKGGIFLRHDSFKAISSTGKVYTQGLNMSYDTCKALFNNPSLLAAIKDSINAVNTIA